MEANFRAFLKKDLSKYSGNWIAISGKNIISSSRNINRVIAEAKRNSKGKEYVFTKVPKRNQSLIL